MYSGDGGCHREAVLRPLSGHQEALLADGPPSPEATSHLLAECLVRVGALTEFSTRRAAALTCGDRDHLLLKLRAAALGGTIRLQLRCPSPGCGSESTLALDTEALCTTEAAAAPNTISTKTPSGRALLREPTGEDMAVIADLPEADRADQLWARQLLRLGEQGGFSAHSWRLLPLATRHTVALAFDRQRRGPQLSGHHSCPLCGAPIRWAAGAGALLSVGLRPGAARLVEEVHALAWHYGWSESDTLALPRQRRWAYLSRLRQALEVAP
ncbi:MAG: hypothetical protein ACI8S6_002451 [Myxococcota bacterium]